LQLPFVFLLRYAIKTFRVLSRIKRRLSNVSSSTKCKHETLPWEMDDIKSLPCGYLLVWCSMKRVRSSSSSTSVQTARETFLLVSSALYPSTISVASRVVFQKSSSMYDFRFFWATSVKRRIMKTANFWSS